MLNTEAPRTFRTPISFMRRSDVKEARLNSPRQAKTTARIAAKTNTFPTRLSC